MLWILRKLHILHTWSKWEDVAIHMARFSRWADEQTRYEVPGQRRVCTVCNKVEEVAI